MDAFRNLKANPDAIGACAPCQVNEIDADAHIMVAGEPWCRDCVECYSDACTLCNAVVDADDLHYIEHGEYVCYACMRAEKTASPQCQDDCAQGTCGRCDRTRDAA